MTYPTLIRISKDKRCWAKCHVWWIYTHTLHFPPAVMNISCHRYPSVILIPLFFCLFLSSFRCKPALRGKQLPSLAALYTSPWTFSHRHPISQWILKNIHTYTTRIAQRWSSILFTRFQQGSLAKTGRWKEIFFPDSKLEKLFARTEIKMPLMHRSVSQSL